MYLLIPAAGKGKRMGSDRNKLLLNVLGEPIISWTLRAAKASQHIHWIGIIGQPEDWPEMKAVVNDLDLSRTVRFIQGGSTRQESVYNGLQDLPAIAQQVLIHDGARCLITPKLFDRCADVIERCDGLIAAIPVKDTIKVVDQKSRAIVQTPDRSNLWAAQTPQGFSVDKLLRCHREGIERGWQVTDDAALFENCGMSVQVVQGEESNLKVTTPMDLAIAEFILRQRQAQPVTSA